MKIFFALIRIHLPFYILCFLFSVNSVFAQNDTAGKIKYTTAYSFKDGFYISFNQVLQNKPMAFDRIISGNKETDNWLDAILKLDKIIFLDEYGVHQSVNINDVWGYCYHGALYVNWSNEFYRIPYIGKLSHYVATQMVRVDNFVDPYSGYYSGMGPTYETSKIIQNIIDFESGKSFPFTIETVQSFLMKDQVLFDEFNLLKKNKKKQLLFMYIRRFNERNPLYLPE